MIAWCFLSCRLHILNGVDGHCCPSRIRKSRRDGQECPSYISAHGTPVPATDDNGSEIGYHLGNARMMEILVLRVRINVGQSVNCRATGNSGRLQTCLTEFVLSWDGLVAAGRRAILAGCRPVFLLRLQLLCSNDTSCEPRHGHIYISNRSCGFFGYRRWCEHSR